MRRAVEAIAFVTIALGAHAAALAVTDGSDGGATAAGQGGTSQISLEAANAQVAEMVERWETPPEMVEAPQVAAMTPPEAPEAPEPPATPRPRANSAEVAPPMPPAPQGLALPDIENAPEIDRETDAAPPPREPEPNEDPDSAAPLRSGERPQVRPDTLRPPEPEPQPQRRAEPEPQDSPSQTSTQRQSASGAGGGTDAGEARQRQATGLSPGQRQNLARQYGARIRATLERRKRYPSAARGASGTVTLRIVVSRTGQLLGASIVSSSGNPALDQAAVRAVRGASFPAAPGQLRDSQYSYTLPMNFSS